MKSSASLFPDAQTGRGADSASFVIRMRRATVSVQSIPAVHADGAQKSQARTREDRAPRTWRNADSVRADLTIRPSRRLESRARQSRIESICTSSSILPRFCRPTIRNRARRGVPDRARRGVPDPPCRAGTSRATLRWRWVLAATRAALLPRRTRASTRLGSW